MGLQRHHHDLASGKDRWWRNKDQQNGEEADFSEVGRSPGEKDDLE